MNKVVKKKVAKKVAKKVVKKAAPRKRGRVKIPDFLSHVALSERQESILKKPMANWIATGKYIKEKGHTVKLMEQMLVFEISSEAPRQIMIEKLMARYNSARRKEVMEQLDRVFSHPAVTQTKKNPRSKSDS